MCACWIHTGLAGNDSFFFFQSILLAIQSLYIADIVDDPRTQHDASVLFANAGTSRYSAFSSPLSSTPFFPPPLDPLSVLFSFSPSFFLSFCAGSATKNRWYIDRDKPSATAAFDLDNSKNESHQHADMAFSVVDGKRSPPASVSARHPQRPPHTHFYSRGTKKKFCPTENISY